jgi:hypothetical protein
MNQWRKDIAAWTCGRTLYLSVPFTWLMPKAEAMAKAHDGPVVAGGPAVKLMGAPWAETPESCPFDVLAYHNPAACFFSRGCPNGCAYCAVPKIEGDYREEEPKRVGPVVCDNNSLAGTRRWFHRMINRLMPFPHVDFNQGLQAARFTPWHASQIARLRGAKVRFALDYVGAESAVADAIAIARAAGLNDIGVYVLFGFKDAPDDALYRMEKVREWGLLPNAQRYQPLDATEKNAYVAPGWTEHELRRMGRYWTRTVWLGHVPYADYNPPEESLFEARAEASGREGA